MTIQEAKKLKPGDYIYIKKLYGPTAGYYDNIIYKILKFNSIQVKNKSLKITKAEIHTDNHMFFLDEVRLPTKQELLLARLRCITYHKQISSNIFNEQLSKAYHILTMSKLK